MANVQFGNTSADMRLVNDFYGIPALNNFATYIDNFDPVRQEIVSLIPRIVIREFNAAGESITVSAAGTLPTGPFSDLAVEAIGTRATVNGAIFLALDGSVSGTATGASVVNVGDGSLIVQISGVSVSIDDISFQVDSIVLAGNDTVTSGSGDDYLLGYAGNDTVSSEGGNDYLEGGAGTDVLNGGPGFDTAVFSAPQSQYTILAAPDGRVAVAYDPRGGDGLDILSGIEQGSFAGAPAALSATASVLEYVASYGDLMNALGANAQAGFDHYVTSGYTEGRSISFDGLEYIASYDDLIKAFHTQVAATGDPDIGAMHYIGNGFAELRPPDLFNAAQYLANYTDLQAAFGTDTEAATLHFITNGYFEHRNDDPLV